MTGEMLASVMMRKEAKVRGTAKIVSKFAPGVKRRLNIFGKKSLGGELAGAGEGYSRKIMREGATFLPVPADRALPAGRGVLKPGVTRTGGQLSAENRKAIEAARNKTNLHMDQKRIFDSTKPPQGAPAPAKPFVDGTTGTTLPESRVIRSSSPFETVETAGQGGILEGFTAPGTWGDKYMQYYKKDPLKTLALTGAGVYGGSKAIDSVFGKQSDVDLEPLVGRKTAFINKFLV